MRQVQSPPQSRQRWRSAHLKMNAPRASTDKCLFVGLAAFIPLGLVTGPRLLAVDRGRGLGTQAGSPVSLVRNLLVFAAQYGIAVALFRHPEAQPSLALAGHTVSSASVGYFIGWTIAFWRRYRTTQDAARTGLVTAGIDESHAASPR
jgi:hypothetical protein